MKNKDYLYAVAAIRASENSLLRQSDLEQLINAPDYKKAVSLLAEKGYEIPSGSDYSSMLDRHTEEVWALVKKSAPDAEELNAFIVKNDFQNLKAILKAEAMSYNAEDYLAVPSVIDPKALLEAVGKRDFDSLPEFIRDAAREAYDTLTKTGNGQLCDVIIDTATLGAIIAFADKGSDAVLSEYARQYVLCADIKTGYRCVKTGKNAAFVKLAVAECGFFAKDSFASAVLAGEEEFMDFLSSNGLSEYREALEKNTTAFEKFCDDRMLEIMKKAKMTAFGVSPIAAYFTAKETEIKCLRIILSAKQSAVSNEVIRERMRELYV